MGLRRVAVVILAFAACPPATVTPPPPSGACPLADDQPFTLATVTETEFMAVDGERLYWLASEGVYSVKKDGTELKKLPVMNPPTMGVGTFGAQTSGGIAVDKTHLYFAVGGAAWRMPREGGLVELVGTSGPTQGLIGQLVLDATHVYWVDTYFGAVHRAQKGRPVNPVFSVLATMGGRTRYLAIDDTSVYWGSYRIGKDGTGLTTLASTAAEGIAVDATSVYWLTPNYGVYRMDKDGQNVTALYESRSPAFKTFGLTQDATKLYFSLGSSFASVNKSGGGFSGDPGSAGSSNRGIVVDAEAVYWSLAPAPEGKVQKRCVATTGVPADPSADSPDAGPVVVEGPPGRIDLPNCPLDFALDGTDAFVVTQFDGTERNKVLRVPLSGGAPTVLEDNVNLWGTRQLASDPRLTPTQIYWVQSALMPMVGSSPQPRYSIKRLDKAGGTATSFTQPSADAISELMLSATHVYWFGHDALFRQGFGETSATSLGSITSLNFFGEVGQTLLDGDTIFFEKSGRLFAIGTDGSSLRSLQDAQLPPGGPSPYGIGGLVTDGADLFWTYSGSSNAHDKVMRMPRSGGAAVELSTMMQSPYDLAVDGTDVYWRLLGVEDVYAVPKAGGARRTVAMGGFTGPYSSVELAQQRLWWTSCSPMALRSIGL